MAEDIGLRNRSRWLALLAVVATLTCLPYSWGRVAIASLLVGAPEASYTAMLLLGIAVVWTLSSRAGRGLGRRGRWTVLATVAILWIVVNVIVVWTCTGPFFPRSYAAPGYTLASLWVLWLAWLPLLPLRTCSKLVVLCVLAGLGAGFFLVYEVEGVMGGEQVNFAWRKWGTPAYTQPALISAPKAAPPEESQDDLRFDYPQFLGPTRTAGLPEVRLNLDWPSHPPRELWRRSVGAGWGSFAVVGDRAVTQEQRGEDECVVCYRLQTGEETWCHGYRTRFSSGYGGVGPRATPAIDSGEVFAVGATGVLSCLDLSTGTVRWSKDILEDNRASSQTHGVCASPLVLDELVIVCPTGESGPTLAAYHRDTGRRIWQAGTDRAGYSSPILADVHGTGQVVVFSTSQVAAFDPATGDPRWEFAWSNSEGVNASQPVVHAGRRNHVLVSTGYGKGSAWFEVAQDAGGEFRTETHWTSHRFRAKFTTPVEEDGRVYALDEGVLACLDVETGERLWKRGRYGHGQILLAGAALVILSEFGDVVLVELTEDGPVEAGTLSALHAKTWNHPALAGPFLLVRNDREAACYRLPLIREGP